MFSGQFYEKMLSVTERNMKLLLENVPCIAIKESHHYNMAVQIIRIWKWKQNI